MKMIRIIIPVILAAITFLPSAASAEQQSEFTIGAILILTGTGANYGEYSKNGAILAQREINAAGGINGRPLKIIYEDETGSSAKAALTAYRKLTSQDHVKFILGPNWQDALVALAPIAQRENVFMITPSTPTSEQIPANIFSTWPDVEDEVDKIAPLIIKSGKRLAILSVQQAWENIVDARLKSTFAKLGGAVVVHETPPPDTTNVKAEVLRVKAGRADVVFISSYALFGVYAQELKKQGIAMPMYGIEVDQAAIDSANGTTEGLIYIGPDYPSSRFSDSFKSSFGKSPDVPASNAYDAVHLLARAINEVGDDPNRVTNYFRSFHDFEGASGLISSRSGRTRMSTAFYVVRNGKFERR